MMHKPLVILGFGGHARSVADLALDCGYQQFIFVDANAKPGESLLHHPVSDHLPEDVANCFLAAGENQRRSHQWELAQQKNLPLINLISTKAHLGMGASMGMANFIGHFCHIGPMSTIGNGCIINNAAIIEQECTIGNFSHISVNATLAGRVSIGDKVFIGASAVVKDGIAIADNITVGAGAVVVHSLQDPGIYVGAPARLLKPQTV